MALFYFVCPTCKKEIKKLFRAESKIKEVLCPIDKTVTIRAPKGSATMVYEVIDNGIMAKRVVQLAGAPQMLEERQEISRKKKRDNSL